MKIENKSDYISPAQACVVSLSGGKIDTKDDEEVILIFSSFNKHDFSPYPDQHLHYVGTLTHTQKSK